MDWTCRFESGHDPETWDGCDNAAVFLDLEDGKHYCYDHTNHDHEITMIPVNVL